jgi:hypothetical protein
VGEDVGDRAHPSPSPPPAGGLSKSLGLGPGRASPGRRGKSQHSAQQALCGAARKTNPGSISHHKDRAVASRSVRLCLAARPGLGIAQGDGATGRAQWAQVTSRRPWLTDRGPKIHKGLSPIPRALRPNEGLGEAPQFRSGPRQWSVHRKQARHHPLDIPVDDVGGLIEGDRGDRGGRIGAQTREATKALLITWKNAAVFPVDGARTGQEIPSPRIVAKARPGRHDLAIRRRREIADRGPLLYEHVEIGRRVDGCGLLKHDLRQPDSIGVRRRTWRGAPRQMPTVRVVPGEQIGAEAGDGRHARR